MRKKEIWRGRKSPRPRATQAAPVDHGIKEVGPMPGDQAPTKLRKRRNQKPKLPNLFF
jgi:hypothetical protein